MALCQHDHVTVDARTMKYTCRECGYSQYNQPFGKKITANGLVICGGGK